MFLARTELTHDEQLGRAAGLGAHIAHAADARWLVTGNAKDYTPLLVAVQSPVAIVDIDAMPTTRKQLTLADQNLKKK